MSENTWIFYIYMLFQVLILVLMGFAIYKRRKNNKYRQLRKKFKLIEGEKVERKVRD